ncbi:MAG: FAD binding domain-containing protein [Aliishimia sp.]
MLDVDTYDRPHSLKDALAILGDPGIRIIAGCTDVLAATERKVIPGHVLDITGIPELRGIAQVPGGLRLGATTTWSDIIKANLPPSLRALQLAGRQVGAVQIQNRGTLAGNLCNASPAADGVPPLLILDAEVELASFSGVRRMALSDFLQGPRQTARTDDEILTGVFIPEAALGGTSHFSKLGARDFLVISIAMVAVRLDVVDGVIRQAACSIGSCGPVATRLGNVENALIGATLPQAVDRIADADVAANLSPIDDVRADAGYRLKTAAELLRRTISQSVTSQGAPA